MKNMLILALFVITTHMGFSQAIPVDSLYFGQLIPGSSPVLFAPGIITLDNRYEHDICFSPDGAEMFFSLSSSDWGTFSILQSKYENNKWSTPELASFSKENQNAEIVFSPDGQNIYFASGRAPGSLPWNFGVFKANKNGADWSVPAEVGIKALQPSNNDGNWHPAITDDSTLYFSSYSKNSQNYDIYRSKMENGSYTSFEKLPGLNSSSSNDWYPWISPDNTYLIFSSNRQGGYGGSDLYVSFLKSDDTWSAPVNLGNKINTSKNESSPRVTFDKKYFFFTRMSESDWDGDFYWLTADFLEGLELTSINQSQGQNLEVYPNPSKGKFNISFEPENVRNAYITVTDINGRIVLSKTLNQTSTHTINLNGYSKGFYFLNLNINNEIINKKIYLE